MNNLILEMKKITNEGRENNLSNDKLRVQLKEYLHFFVLDFIYNSQFKELIFYGGSCLRIIYDLPRMSEDLDFEADENIDFKKIAQGLENHFNKNLKLKEKFSINREKSINRIFLNIPIMYELGLSDHKNETLRIKVEIRPVSKIYLKKIQPIFTPILKYGNSFMIKHYDLSTLFASKLIAILDRPNRGFAVGKIEDSINYKGRDFFDMLWYMEKNVLPNEEMFKANKIKKSIEDIFNEISFFILEKDSKRFKKALKKDLEPLFIAQNIDSYTETFLTNFQNLKKRYIPKKIELLNRIIVSEDLQSDDYLIEFNYLSENNENIFFLFRLSYEFFHYLKKDKINKMKYKIGDDKIYFKISNQKDKDLSKEYLSLFLLKINDYLKLRQNKVYFNIWKSKFIRISDDNLKSEKQIAFSTQKLISDKKITLEVLSL